MEDNKITFINDDGEEEIFYIVDETKVNGVSYILVTETNDQNDDDEDAYIMKDVSGTDDPEAKYVFVDDESEIDSVANIFAELLDEDTELIQ